MADQFLFLRFLNLNLCKRVTHGVRVFHPLIHLLNDCDVLILARLKPGDGSFFPIFHVGAGAQTHGPSCAAFLGVLPGGHDKWSNQVLKQQSYEIPASVGVAYPDTLQCNLISLPTSRCVHLSRRHSTIVWVVVLRS